GVDRDLPVYRYLQGVIMKECPGQALSEQQARNLAGAFLFSGDEQLTEMGLLSGGERSRAVLAGLLASAKNVLGLDEPTNHLDIPSAERLEDALSVEEEIGGVRGNAPAHQPRSRAYRRDVRPSPGPGWSRQLPGFPRELHRVA